MGGEAAGRTQWHALSGWSSRCRKDFGGRRDRQKAPAESRGDLHLPKPLLHRDNLNQKQLCTFAPLRCSPPSTTHVPMRDNAKHPREWTPRVQSHVSGLRLNSSLEQASTFRGVTSKQEQPGPVKEMRPLRDGQRALTRASSPSAVSSPSHISSLRLLTRRHQALKRPAVFHLDQVRLHFTHHTHCTIALRPTFTLQPLFRPRRC